MVLEFVINTCIATVGIMLPLTLLIMSISRIHDAREKVKKDYEYLYKPQYEGHIFLTDEVKK